MPYLGLDLGSKTLGVSISDKSNIISSPLEVIRYEKEEELFNRLREIIDEKNITKIILGNPLNMNGTESKRSIISYEFKNKLTSEFNIEVIMQDERLSTVEAENILISNNTRRKKRRKVIDKMASTIILQTYLDRSNNEKKLP